MTDNNLNVASTTQKILLTGTGTTVAKVVYVAAPAASIVAGGSAGSAITVKEETSANGTTTATDQVKLTVTGPNGYSQVYMATAVSGTATFNLSAVSSPPTVAGTNNYTYTASLPWTSGSNNAAATESVTAGSLNKIVVALPASVISHVAFTATYTAADTYGNTVTSYAGTVHSTSSDGASILPANYMFVAGDNGVHAFTNGVTLGTLGSQSVTATDTVTTSVTGSALTNVIAGPADHFIILTPSNTVAGTVMTFTVTAYDASGNMATSCAGSVVFSSTDGAAILPANSPLAAGTGTFSATLKTTGGQTITTVDASVPSITGTSVTITVSTPNLLVTVGTDDAGTAANCVPQAASGTGTDANCSLRDAIAAAVLAGAGSISFDGTHFNAPQTITLTNGPLTLPSNTTIAGPVIGSGATLTNLLTVNANGVTAFVVNSGSTSGLANLIITNGSGLNGGDIANAGTLSISKTTISVGMAQSGGGIYNAAPGTLTVRGSTISGNTAAMDGGGIANAGTLSLIDTTIAGNTAAGNGGGVSKHGNTDFAEQHDLRQHRYHWHRRRHPQHRHADPEQHRHRREPTGIGRRCRYQLHRSRRQLRGWNPTAVHAGQLRRPDKDDAPATGKHGDLRRPGREPRWPLARSAWPLAHNHLRQHALRGRRRGPDELCHRLHAGAFDCSEEYGDEPSSHGDIDRERYGFHSRGRNDSTRADDRHGHAERQFERN